MSEVRAIRPSDPHNVEAEQQVLGAILGNNGLYDRIAGWINEEHFFDPLHADIFGAMSEMIEAGDLASPITLRDRFLEHAGMKEIGFGYLARLMGGAVQASEIRHYANILVDSKAKREIVTAIRSASQAITEGDQSADVIAAELESAIGAIASRSDARRPISMLSAVKDAMKDVLDAMSGEIVPGVRFGLPALERYVPLMAPGQLVLLGGRPSMGKTGVALSVSLNAARCGHGVIIVSLEMLPKALALRAVSEQSSHLKRAVPFADMLNGNVPDILVDPMKDAARGVANLPIQFLSRDYGTIGAMTAGVKEAMKVLPKGVCPLVVIDYAQLLQSAARTRYDQITEISIALKGMAMRLEAPVLALSQLSRAVEQREDKRPMLSDLRESGQLEQDADAVLFCYRDEYYLERDRPEEDDIDGQEKWQGAMDRARNRLEIIVAKNRQGPVGTAHMMFNPALNVVWENGR